MATPSCGRHCGRAGVKADPDYVDKDGSIDMKFGWRGVSGRLSIQGRRLDAPAPRLRAEVSDGYGDRSFQASGVIFPTVITV